MSPSLEKQRRVAIVLETSILAHREVLNGILRFAAERGRWITRVFEHRYDEPSEFALDDASYDGAIGQFHCPRYAIPLKKADIPLVVTYPDTARVFKPKPPFLAFLDCDNAQIGTAAAEYFLKSAYASFAFIPTQTDAVWSERRGAAFISRLMTAGRVCSIFPHRRKRPADATPREEEDLIRWLTALPRPVAVFAANDTRAHHVLNACLRGGIAVPDDVAILGCDDNPAVCEALSPTLSSIRLATEQAGYLAAQALDRAMRGESTRDATPRLFAYGSAGIVVRQSTDRDYAKDVLVRRVVELIRTSHGVNLSIARLVADLHVSRRTLEVRFKRQTGKTLHEAISAARLQEVKRLALDGHTVAEIAERCGYATPAQLSAAFRKMTGETIRQFRQRKV